LLADNVMDKINLESFKTTVSQLDIDDASKREILKSFKVVEKDIDRLDFLHKRNVKDKSITINMLESTFIDLQNQKNQLEQQSLELEKNLNAMKMLYQELEQFSYVASHDLKSPLRNIGSYAQLLNRKYKDKLDEDANMYLNFIVSNAQLMNSIIRDLLEYNSLEHNKQLAQTNLNKTIEHIQLNLKDVLNANNVTVEFENLPEIWTYQSSTLQLFHNLIDNAIKHRSEVAPHIVIKAKRLAANSGWEFSVKDNGIGLDEKYKDKVFSPFQRINTASISGTGMGLAICKKVVRLHGGDIWYEKNKDLGTTFFFTLPQMKVGEGVLDNVNL
jgi:light-regulated signal transduction histidine kinase (bacteriophytochrome)